MKKIILLLMTVFLIGACGEESSNSVTINENGGFTSAEFQSSILESKGIHPQDLSFQNERKVLDLGKRQTQIVYNATKFNYVESESNENFKRLLELYDVSNGHFLFSSSENIFLFLAEEDGSAETLKVFFDKTELDKLKTELENEFSYYGIQIDYTFRSTVNAMPVLIFKVSGKDGGLMEDYNGYIMSFLEDREKQIIVFGMAPKLDNKRIEIEKIVSTFCLD